MRTRITTVLFLVVTLVLGICSSVVFADGPGSKKEKKFSLEDKLFKKARFILKNKEELGLSDKQIKKIKDTKLEAKKDLIKKKANIEIIALDIKAAMYEETLDIGAISKLIDEKYDLKKEKAKGLVKACAVIKNTLTEEQRTTLKGLWKDKMKDKMGCPMMMKGMMKSHMMDK